MAFNFPRILLSLAAIGSIVLLGYWLWDYVLPYVLY